MASLALATVGWPRRRPPSSRASKAQAWPEGESKTACEGCFGVWEWYCESESRSASHAYSSSSVPACSIWVYYFSDIIQDDPIFTYNPMPIHNLTSSLPQIQFSNYFASKNPRAYPERVIITYPAYVHSLSLLLEDTSNDVIESYLVIRSALTLAPNLGLNTEAYKAARSLQETLQGIKPGSVGDRSELCIGKVEGTLGFAAGRYFVNQTFSGNSKDKATKVIMGTLNSGYFFLYRRYDGGVYRHCGCFQTIAETTGLDG